MAYIPLTLATPGLRATEDGAHEYVLSRTPAPMEANALMSALEERGDDLPGRVTYMRGDAVAVEGLSDDNRKSFEDALRACLMETNRVERALGAWVEDRAEADAAADAEVSASFERLPPDLP